MKILKTILLLTQVFSVFLSELPELLALPGLLLVGFMIIRQINQISIEVHWL